VLDVDTTIEPPYGEQEGAKLGYNPHKVVVCCQWTPETTGLFDRRRFAAMKLGSVLVNVARGEIIDEDALAEALEQDRPAASCSTSIGASSSMLRRPGSGSIRGC
jgi:D-isomer specific 2-hydroxyacid dehydrogenase, NAD binding domain